MAMYGAPGTAQNEASRLANEQYLRDEEEKKRKISLANAANAQPTATEVGRTEGGMFTDSTPINAYYLDPTAAGSQSQFQTADFYDYLRQAQQQGQNIYGQQQGLADILLARSQGRGTPSLAQLQLQQSLEQNKRDAAGALAAAGRSINPALAQRLLLNQQSQLQGKTAGDAAMLRAKEQLDAQAAYANQLANMRNSETSMYGTSGQLGLGQEKLSVETQEDQKRRELEVARANQEAAKAASGQAANTAIANQRANNELVGDVAGGVGTAINQKAGSSPAAPAAPATPNVAAAYNGGYIKRKNYAEGGKINAAMGKLTKMDNEKNDTVPAMLSPGEIVLPRSIVAAPNAPVAAARFVEALLANRDKKDAKKVALMAALGKK